jgi:hypothetical protein
MYQLLRRIYGLESKRDFKDACRLAATMADDDPRLIAGLQTGTRLLAEIGYAWSESESRRQSTLKAEAEVAAMREAEALAEKRKRFATDDAASFWVPFCTMRKAGDGMETDYFFDHVVLTGSKSDLDKLTKKFKLPDTLTWKRGDTYFIMYESRGHHMEPFRGDRLNATASFFSGINDTTRIMIPLYGSGVAWVRQPTKALAKDAPGLPRLPDELLYALAGTNGNPDRAKAVERLLLD